MKNKKITFLILTLSFLVSLLITSCDVKNPVDGLELRVKTLARTTVVSVSIYDAATENLIKPDQVEVTFQGKDGDKIITLSNEQITRATTTTGILNFAVSDNTIPTPNSPVEITAVVTAPDYISSSVQIFITSPGASSHSIQLANVYNTPEGVESEEESKSGVVDEGGNVTEKVTFYSLEDTTNAKATITIPEGTVLKDKDGNPLTGDIQTRVSYFDPMDEESLNSFPGGFSVNTGVERGSFVTAGFVAIDMTVGGTEVEQFGSEVTVQIAIPKDLLNPETGQPLAPNDIVPLWSYDEKTGEWKKEGEVIVPESSGLAKVINGESYYRVSTKINHLSYWNLDWFQDACVEGITINITGGCYPYLQIKAKRVSDGVYFYSGWIDGNDRIVQLYYAPRNVPVIAELWDVSVYPSVRIAEMQIDDLCGADVNFPITQSNGMVEVTATATAVCHNSDGTVKSRFYPNNYPLYVRHPNNLNWNYIGQIIEGQISTCLELGINYTFGTYIDGALLEYNYTVTQTNIEMEFSDLEYPEEMRDFCN